MYYIILWFLPSSSTGCPSTSALVLVCAFVRHIIVIILTLIDSGLPFGCLACLAISDPAKLAPPTDLSSARLSYLLALRPSIFFFSKLCSLGAGLTGLWPFPPCPLSISSFWDPCDSPHPPRLRKDWLLPLFWTTSYLSRTLDSARATVTRSFFLIPSLSSLDLPSR